MPFEKCLLAYLSIILSDLHRILISYMLKILKKLFQLIECVSTKVVAGCVCLNDILHNSLTMSVCSSIIFCFLIYLFLISTFLPLHYSACFLCILSWNDNKHYACITINVDNYKKSMC